MQKHRRIKGLDGLRALCVLLVFIEHFLLNGHNLGGLGVKIFFTLSGYLIIGILHKQRLQIELGASRIIEELVLFWQRRALRIFPIYYISLIGILIYSYFKGFGYSYQGLPFYASFMGNYYIQNISQSWGKFTHLWSISVEQHFYMLTSFFLLLLAARKHFIFVVVVLIISICYALYEFMHWKDVLKPNVGDLPNYAYMAVGGIFAIRPSISRRININTLSFIFVVSASLFVLASTNFYPLKHSETGFLPFLLWLSMIGICLVTIAYIPKANRSTIVSFLEAKPLRYLGTISYGFYVYHYFFPNLTTHTSFFPWLPNYLAFTFLALLQFALTCLVASISWHFIEKPIMSFKMNRI